MRVGTEREGLNACHSALPLEIRVRPASESRHSRLPRLVNRRKERERGKKAMLDDERSVPLE